MIKYQWSKTNLRNKFFYYLMNYIFTFQYQTTIKMGSGIRFSHPLTIFTVKNTDTFCSSQNNFMTTKMISLQFLGNAFNALLNFISFIAYTVWAKIHWINRKLTRPKWIPLVVWLSIIIIYLIKYEIFAIVQRNIKGNHT